jgi:cell division protein FtsA
MNYFKINPVYSVIDIGTTKIIVIIAEQINNELSILGIGISPSHGLEKGMVTDIKKTTESIKKALEEAIFQAHIIPEYVTIGISGNHIKSYFSQGMIAISSEGINEQTIEQVLASSQSIVLPDDEKIIHSIPVSFVIDGYNIVKNPLGMHGIRLEINSHIITANKNAIEDLIECCKKLGLKIKDVVLEPIASAEAILNEQEKAFGSLLIDIGGGTSDVALYKNNSLELTSIISIGGVLLTNDISICLNCNKDDAEEIKKKYGLLHLYDNNYENIKIKSFDMETEISTSSLLIHDILYARCEELIFEIIKLINQYNYNYYIPSGIILTGGGSLLKGLPDMISKYTGIKCRIGYPLLKNNQYSLLKNPIFATAYGLLLYEIEHDNRFLKNTNSIFHKFKNWINKFI